MASSSHEDPDLQFQSQAESLRESRLAWFRNWPSTEPPRTSILYVPVFRSGKVPQTVEARRQQLQGWVCAPFRMDDFSRALLGDSWPDLRVEIYDGPEPTGQGLLFDSHPGNPHQPRFLRHQSSNLHGRAWTFRISSRPGLEQRLDGADSRPPPGERRIISLLIFGRLQGLVRFRRRAHQLAHQMTAVLRGEQEHVRRILDSTGVGL